MRFNCIIYQLCRADSILQMVVLDERKTQALRRLLASLDLKDEPALQELLEELGPGPVDALPVFQAQQLVGPETREAGREETGGSSLHVRLELFVPPVCLIIFSRLCRRLLRFSNNLIPLPMSLQLC